MARKIKLTRPELKHQRDALARFERYLPTLKLKQQQLQLSVREVAVKLREAASAVTDAREKATAYSKLLTDLTGINVLLLSKPTEIRTEKQNVAGVNIPVLTEVIFSPVNYSLFATPPWVDKALIDLRRLNQLQAEQEILQTQYQLLNRELIKITQRVNLFEKVKIPESREDIRVIRIHLGDEMTAAVGRAKIAKAKLTEIDAPMAGVSSTTTEGSP